jgi:glycosyltransferase involved in cell wall biosynthesis
MRKKVLFYSSVKDVSDFATSSFYSIDIKILSDLGFDVEVTNKISAYFKYSRYDIAFIYFYRMGFFAGLIARVLGKHVFFTGGIDNLAPDYASLTSLEVQRIFFALCYCVATTCIIVSASDLANIRLFWRAQKKLLVVPHAIVTTKFNPSLPKEDIITSICWMGSIANVRRKGVDKLIQGFAIFRQSYPSFLLYIVGRFGEGYNYLRQIAEKLGVYDSIVFCGSVSEEEKVGILAKSKYYGQLSQFEGFGMAAIEAMASGCIVVNSGRGGLKETVKGYGALVPDINNPEAIANTFIKCELAIKEYQHLAMKGCENVRSYFDYANRYSAFKAIID